MLFFHHSRPLAGVAFGDVISRPEFSGEYHDAYTWLEKEVGFYPVFLSVGNHDVDIYMTGYQANWAVCTSYTWDSEGRKISSRRKKGEFPNDVLFSFASVEGVFTDYQYWHLVLSATWNNGRISDREMNKPSWPRSRWLRYAEQKPHSVQVVVPKLFLPAAERVWVRNRATKGLLENMGFGGVAVKRIPLEYDYEA